MEKPKTSRQLKKLILEKEEEVRNDRKIIHNFFQPVNSDRKSFNMLNGLLKTVKLTPNLKTELIKAVVGFIAGFVAKKWLAPKVEEKETELSDKRVEEAMRKAIDKNSNGMDLAEREMLKKLLHQYIISK